MNKLEKNIHEIIKVHRKKRKYLVRGTTFDNPSWFPVYAIWFTEIFEILYPQIEFKTNMELKRDVKRALLNLEKNKLIFYGVGEPPFYILYEDKDKIL